MKINVRFGKTTKETYYNRMVLDVIKDYAAKNNDITLDELIKAFPFEPFGQFKTIKIYDENNKEDRGRIRYFIKENELIILKDGTKLAVCSQWDKKVVEEFIEYVNKQYKYDIEILK